MEKSESAAPPAVPPVTPSLSAEEILKTLYEVALNGILILRPLLEAETDVVADFIIEYANPEGQRIIGVPERPGFTIISRFPHLQHNGVLDFYRRVFMSGGAERMEVHYQNDGLDNLFQLSAKRCGDLLVVNFNDVPLAADSSQKKTGPSESGVADASLRAELNLQIRQLYNIYMQTPALICIFEGPEHVFKLVNPAYQQLVGDRPIMGKPIAEAMPELEGQPIFDLLDQVYQTGQPFQAHEMMVQLDHANNGELGQNYYDFIYQATRNLDGEIDGVLVFAYEVTAQVQARKLLEDSHKEVRELNRQLETRVAQRTEDLSRAQAEAERQRRRLERLFMQAPAAICILSGPQLVYELVNPGYQQLFPERRLLGRPILEALPEIEHNLAYATFRKVYETGITHQENALLIPFVHPDSGQLVDRYFTFIQQARINEQGQIDGVLVFAFEVTTEAAARKAVEASARQLKLLTDSLPVLIGYLDKEEKYRFANKAYKAWFNQDPEQLLGRPVREVVGEKAYSGVKQYINRALAGEELAFEAKMPYREGFTKYIRTNYVPDMQMGEVAGFYTLVLDITEQTEAQQAVEASEQQAQALALELATANEDLLRTNQQLTRTNSDLDNFIYAASHDLKAPISNIEGLLRLMERSLTKEGPLSAQVAQVTGLMQESVERFKRTIINLTEVVKLQKESNQLQAPVTLGSVVQDVLKDLQPLIEEAGAQVELQIADCPPINFSEKNLRSVIYNLLSNALKYRSPERSPLLRLGCAETGQWVIITVRDNGLGMRFTDQSKLFGMFSRLHDHVEGSGIGLYMVKKMLENAGGKIEVESRLDEGSTFTVYFRK
ncbi:PAS domain-containing sensor histidine kinase [Cesiribacter andamanensis]|uniref:histidine kinase n=1 Tax=Cesiribacter andamanensis AMV16 TaxID=1279009 RepID=M7NY42_9BACT|nr:PAS domain-containing protein [Cesiribacter andamanensis]EMR03269.1 Phytochrome-like protein cph1 [Cesiribacter andamanensis AMV16]